MESSDPIGDACARGFTALEAALIKLAIPFAEAGAEAMAEQFDKATVTDRTFTGVGSFTNIAVPPECPPVPSLPAIPFAPAGARLGRDGHLLESILWLEQGKLACIELFLLDPPATPIDLTTVSFEVEAVWPLQSKPPTVH